MRLHVNNAPLRDAYALIQGALRDMHEAHDFANIPWVSEVMRLSGLDIIQFTLLRLGVNFEQLESQGVESLGALFVELGIPSNPALFVINQGDIDAHPDVYRSTLGLSLRRFLGLCGNPQLSSENAMISVVIDLVLSSLYELGGGILSPSASMKIEHFSSLWRFLKEIRPRMSFPYSVLGFQYVAKSIHSAPLELSCYNPFIVSSLRFCGYFF